ncbi:hypothetical protein Pelo_16420 [Pelomyxa schiedti]|nr:hypothetical protein Pelo_16420 [Pelomyxa schiedti]
MTGIVPPEPEVKKVVDKLVEFVLSNGTKFEVIVRERERSNPRFSFLLPWDTNNAYYNLRINFFRKRESNAGQDIISSDRVADNPEIAPTPSRPSIIVLPTGTTKPPLPNATRSIPCLKETPSPPEHTTNAPGSPEETHLGNTKLPAAPHTPSNPALFNNKLLPEHPEQPSPQLPAMQTSTPVPAPKSTDPVQLPPFPGHNLFPPILHTNKSTTTAAQASPPDTKRARLLRVKALLSSQLL